MANIANCSLYDDFLKGDCILDVSGLSNLYLVNAADIQGYTTDVLTEKELLTITLKDGKRGFKFEFKFNSAKWMAELLVNGTTRNVRHTVEFQLGIFTTPSELLVIEQLLTAKLVAFVETRKGDKFMLGTPKAYLKASAVTVDSGAAEEDPSNISATITGIVAAMPLIVDAAIDLESLLIPVGTPAVPVLTAPTNGAANQLNNGLLLDWAASVNAVSYQYRYATSEAALALAVPTSTALTQATLNGLTLGQSYYWQVRAVNGALISEYSDIFAFTVITTPLAPTITIPSNGANVSAGGFGVTYTLSDGADFYEIEVSDNGAPFALAGISNIASFAVPGPLTGPLVDVRVRAVNNAGNSAYSAIGNYSVGVAPAVPTITNPTDGDNIVAGLIQILHTAVNASMVQIVIERTAIAPGIQTFSLQAGDPLNYTIVLGEDYEIKARAINQFGTSAYTAIVNCSGI